MIDEAILRAFRSWGYLQADLDWLGRLPPLPHSELDVAGSEPYRKSYCGTLAAEFMHIPDPERRAWVASAMESEPEAVDTARLLEDLMRASILEETLQKRYIGNKRFSIEGIEALIPLLTEMLDRAGALGAEKALLAMAHRGRLNVMAHVVGSDLLKLFAGFEDVEPESILGAGDVKYHLGATGTRATPGGDVDIHLVSNPSHLEAVDPVALGRARAKQVRLGDAAGELVVPILMHGDAAFAGQGVTADRNLAIENYKAAARLGNTKAQEWLRREGIEWRQ